MLFHGNLLMLFPRNVTKCEVTDKQMSFCFHTVKAVVNHENQQAQV